MSTQVSKRNLSWFLGAIPNVRVNCKRYRPKTVDINDGTKGIKYNQKRTELGISIENDSLDRIWTD